MKRLIFLMMLSVFVAGCGSQTSTIPYAALPTEGDPVRGEQLYHQLDGTAPTCANCHRAGAAAAPQIDSDYPEIAAQRVEGQDAREYSFYAIVEPGQHIVEGYGNAMYNRYDETLDPQEIADLIAYMLNE